jgi:predicted component of type VI protein secretion system
VGQSEKQNRVRYLDAMLTPDSDVTASQMTEIGRLCSADYMQMQSSQEKTLRENLTSPTSCVETATRDVSYTQVVSLEEGASD